MFGFVNDYLSCHHEFENASMALGPSVSHGNHADQSCNAHVFEHRELIRDCDYCMLPDLELSRCKG